jgi:transposase
MVAVTQVAHRHSEGRAYYDRKLKESKTNEEALRSLRHICDAIFARLVADANAKAEAAKAAPGGQRGNGSVSSVAGSHPELDM